MQKNSNSIGLIKFAQITENHCGPAVIQMLLQNLDFSTTQEEITIASGAEKTIIEEGTRIDQLAKAVKNLAPQFSLYYKFHSNLDDIKVLLDKFMLPVGVEWQGIFESKEEEQENSDKDYGHYSVITNIDEEKKALIIVDPYKEFVDSDRIISINEFETRWWDENEITGNQSTNPEIIHDDRLLFVISSTNTIFPPELGLKTF
jgi:hypothetical protein